MKRPAWLPILGLLLVPIAAFAVYVRFGGDRGPASDPGEAPSAPPEAPAEIASTPPARSDPVLMARRLERSDPKGARKLLREAIAADPEDVRALSALSRKLLNDENHKEARELALACLRLSPKDSQCDSVRRHALEPKDTEASLAALGRCLAENPKSAPCLAGSVVEHIRAGNLAEAARLSARLQAIDEKGRFTLLSLGRVRAAQGDYAAARVLFDEACAKKDQFGCYRSQALREEGW